MKTKRKTRKAKRKTPNRSLHGGGANRLFPITMTEKMRGQVMRAAEKAGVSAAAWVREAIRAAIERG